MTAPGGGILAWLDNAITAREETARDASDGPWWVEHPRTVWGPGPDIEVAASCGTIATLPEDGNGMLNALHVSANAPETVMRRCAADRRLMALHNVPAVVYPNSGARADDRRCVGCGFDSHEEPMVDDVNDCPTLHALAEGYGWTGASDER